jgi:hypothetical protein
MKNRITSDLATAKVQISVDPSYIGKMLNVYYSDDDITWKKATQQIVKSDGV